MTLTNLTLGMLLTTGVSTFTASQLQDKLTEIEKIEYEQVEDITAEMSMKEKIAAVRRNDERRKKLIFKLNNVLNKK